MSSGNSTRETRTVIMTDRVIVPGEFRQREWDVSDRLWSTFYPCGWKGLQQNVLVVVNDPGHIAPVSAVAAALVARGSVEERDFGYRADAHRQLEAMRAESYAQQAIQELREAHDQEYLDDLVRAKMVNLLNQRKPLRVALMTDWEYAGPFFGGLLLSTVSDHKAEMIDSMLGDADISNVLMRQYKTRGNGFFRNLSGAGRERGDNAPVSNQIELTQKYLGVVFPHLMPSLATHLSVDLTQRPVVTPRRNRVTTHPKKSGHEKINRPVEAPTFSSVCKGLVTR